MGVNVPIHVIVNPNTKQKECSQKECYTPSMPNMRTFECEHLKRVMDVPRFEEVWYKNLYLSCLSDEERFILNSHLHSIQNSQVSPVVEWSVNNETKCFSVPAFKDSSITQFGRNLVGYDKKLNKYRCSCRYSKKISACIHKILCKLYQAHKYPNSIQEPIADDPMPTFNSQTDYLSDEEPCTEENTTNFTIQIKEKEWRYQFENKKYPALLPKEVLGKKYEELSRVKLLTPIETICHICKSNLTKQFMLTKSATIYDVKFKYDNVKLYYKTCIRCNSNYYYKEWRNGLHVASNKLILTFDLCLQIREYLLQGSAVCKTTQAVVSMLQRYYGPLPVTASDICDAYTDFEIMTDHSYSYTCNICGEFPKILMTSTCRQGCFNLSSDIVANARDSQVRNMSEFWHDVSKSLIMKEKLPHIIRMWSPWISPGNVGQVISSESCRGSSESSRLNDCMFNEKEITHALAEKDKLFLVQYLKKQFNVVVDINCSRKALVKRVYYHLQRDDAQKNILTDLFGGSGAWIALSCTHGIVYGLKILLKAESPNDYADLVLSMAHNPQILICDMPDRVARCIHERNSSLLRPNFGMLVSPSASNLQLVNDGLLEVELDFLDDEYDETHTGPGLNKMFVLFDESHKINTYKKSEQLRNVKLVTNFPKINKEIYEGFKNIIGRDNYYLKDMTIRNHIFDLRLAIHLHNEDKNITNMKMHYLDCKLPAQLLLDEYGNLVCEF